MFQGLQEKFPRLNKKWITLLLIQPRNLTPLPCHSKTGCDKTNNGTERAAKKNNDPLKSLPKKKKAGQRSFEKASKQVKGIAATFSRPSSRLLAPRRVSSVEVSPLQTAKTPWEPSPEAPEHLPRGRSSCLEVHLKLEVPSWERCRPPAEGAPKSSASRFRFRRSSRSARARSRFTTDMATLVSESKINKPVGQETVPRNWHPGRWKQ